MPTLELHNAGISFRMSYSRVWTLREWFWGFLTGHHRKHKDSVHWALQNISIDVRPGEVLGVIGRNGCGKTTLLRLMAGILEPDQGSVHVEGRVTSLLGLGAGFNPTASGRMNIFLNGLILGMSHDEIQRKADEIIAFADIGDFIDVPVKYYSNGMIARLGFAIATAMDPDILLVDEILSTGDLTFQDKSRDRMEELRKKARMQVLVSHDLDFIEQECHRVLFLEQGTVRFYGETREAVKRYRESCDQPAEKRAVR